MRLAMAVIARRRHTEDVPLFVYQRYQSSPQLRIIRSIKLFLMVINTHKKNNIFRHHETYYNLKRTLY